MQIGDEVWLLKGGNVLYILRPRSIKKDCAFKVLDCTGALSTTRQLREDENSYEFVGEAFIHGLMDGELLGMMGEHPTRERLSPLEGMDRHFRNVALV